MEKEKGPQNITSPVGAAMGPVAIARLCHVAPETVYRWIEEGKIPAFKTAGGHRRVFVQDVEIFLKKLNLPAPSRTSPFKVVVVDDQQPIRELVIRWLRREYPGVEIGEAGNGFEAGRQLAMVKPDVLILDIFLPGMNGFEVCHTIRADARFDHTKILAISGSVESDLRERIVGAGADGFLAKPILREALLAAIRDWIPGHASPQA